MSISISPRFTILAAASLSLGLALQAPSALAQTASDVVCVGCVDGVDIANGTIGPNKLIPGSINATTIANGVIGPNKLIPGSINTTTIANDAIRSNKILDGAVQSADIQDNGVTSVDIQDGTVTSVDIQDNTITSVDIQNSTITGADIAPNTIGQADIATNGVGSLEIAAGAVGSNEAAGLRDFDITDEAGMDFSGGNQATSITSADTVVRSVTITAPTSGRVAIMASGYFDENLNPTVGRCSISLTTSLDFNALIEAELTADNDHIPFSAVRGFAVGTGSDTYNLVCDITAGTGNALVIDTHMVGMFFPTVY